MDSLIFPEAETRLICQSFPEFCFCFFLKTIICNNLFHMLLHTKDHHTWHNLCRILSHFSRGHPFDHPSLPKIIWGERKGRIRNAYIPLKGNSPSDIWEFQSYNNPFCSCCRNPPLSPKACPSPAVLDREKWLCCYCHLVLQLPIHSVHPLPQTPSEAIDR